MMSCVNRPADINDGMLFTRNTILRGVCAIYLVAFAGFYYQSAGRIQTQRSQLNQTDGAFFISINRTIW